MIGSTFARPHERVVDVVEVGRLQVAVAAAPRLARRASRKSRNSSSVAADGAPAALGQALELARAAPAAATATTWRRRASGRRRGTRAVRLVPGHPAQRREVGLEHEVAVALRPRRQRVALDGVHLDVHGQQVVARPRPRGRATSSRKWRAVSRLPCRRPCMSVSASSTVSIWPSTRLSAAPRASSSRAVHWRREPIRNRP